MAQLAENYYLFLVMISAWETEWEKEQMGIGDALPDSSPLWVSPSSPTCRFVNAVTIVSGGTCHVDMISP